MSTTRPWRTRERQVGLSRQMIQPCTDKYGRLAEHSLRWKPCRWSFMQVLCVWSATGRLLWSAPTMASVPRWWPGSGHRGRGCVVVQLPPSTRPHYSRQNGPAAAAAALGCPLSRWRARRICRARCAVSPRRRISPATRPLSADTHVYRNIERQWQLVTITIFSIWRFRLGGRSTRRQTDDEKDACTTTTGIAIIVYPTADWSRFGFYFSWFF